MKNKTNEFYFNNFIECAEYSCKAASMLEHVLMNFDSVSLKAKMDELHTIEHDADDKKHEMMSALVKAFITPIEREDIIKLSQTIDNVTDSIEDILIQIYISGVTSVRDDVLAFIRLIYRCCELTKLLLTEFRDFKKSKQLGEIIIALNHLEEDGDDMYIQAMRNLHATSQDPLEIIVWREIYHYFEKVCDACEDVADIVEGIAIGNL